MPRSSIRKVACLAAGFAPLLVGFSVLCPHAKAETAEAAGGSRYRALHVFKGGSNGSWPTGRLAGDPNVALFGVTSDGGRETDRGTVYRLTRKGTDVWRHDVIFDAFSEKNGYDPQALVAVDDRLIGVTHSGGRHGAGTIFELRKRSPSSKRWRHSVLHSFNVDDGAEVQSLTYDKANGVVYGATSRGGDLTCGFGDGCGVVFALRSNGDSGDWAFEVIHRFAGGADGWRPWGDALTFARGALYGTTHFGGADCVDDSPYDFDCGTVYRLDPPARTGGAWTKAILYSFEGKLDGARPSSSLVVRGGSIYGTTIMNGEAKRGTVFEIAQTQGGPVFSVVYAVQRNQYYIGGLAAGAGGALYATGETNKCASVFSLAPSRGSEQYSVSVLKRFKEDAPGCFPDGSLRFVGSENAVYGATWDGGAADAGAIYRLRLPEPPTQ